MSDNFKVIRAWLVHFYTSLGLVAALGAFVALLEHRAQGVFLWQGLALFIDATDGPLARKWEVSRWTPGFNGAKLDDIVDYINYTLIPVIFAYQFGIVSGSWLAVLPLVLISSAYGFSQEAAKTEDGYFTGFPSYWNITVFYLYLLETSPWESAVILGVLALLVFVPVTYITWRSTVLPRLTFIFSTVWFLSLGILVLFFNHPLRWMIWISLLYPAYHLGTSFYITLSTHLIQKGKGVRVRLE